MPSERHIAWILLSLSSISRAQITLFPDVFANASNTGFGVGVAALSKTGSTLAVGAEFRDANRGGAFLFACAAGKCKQAQIVTLNGQGTPGDLLGHGLALSTDGSTLVLGAPGRNTTAAVSAGSVFTAACIDSICGILNELILPDGMPGDAFGISVAVSSDGSVLAIGADGRDGGNGTVYVYSCSAGVVSDRVSRISD